MKINYKQQSEWRYFSVIDNEFQFNIVYTTKQICFDIKTNTKETPLWPQ